MKKVASRSKEDEIKSSNPEQSVPEKPEEVDIPIYPDWTAFQYYSQEETMRQVSLAIKTSPEIVEILKKIAFEELRTMSGQVEMILVKWLEAEGHLKKKSKGQLKAIQGHSKSTPTICHKTLRIHWLRF